MYPRDYRSTTGRRSKSRRPRTPLIKMDPDCAVCGRPATAACDCEAKGLEASIRLAEARMMQPIYADIRKWVKAHAQDYILNYFRERSDRRKAAHRKHMDRIEEYASYHFRSPPDPNEVAHAQESLKRGIDEDWQLSVERYPEVLEYFFSLVELTVPGEEEAVVKNPMLDRSPSGRKAGRRVGDPNDRAPPTITSGSFASPESLSPLWQMPHASPPLPFDRRTPGPQGSRPAFRPPSALPPEYYGPPPPRGPWR